MKTSAARDWRLLLCNLLWQRRPIANGATGTLRGEQLFLTSGGNEGQVCRVGSGTSGTSCSRVLFLGSYQLRRKYMQDLRNKTRDKMFECLIRPCKLGLHCHLK